MTKGQVFRMLPHAVRDIGMKLNAVSYVGWDCSVETEVSVYVPSFLMEELDTQNIGGEFQSRAASEAVEAVNTVLYNKSGRFRVFSGTLRCIVKNGANERVIDLNKKPN